MRNIQYLVTLHLQVLNINQCTESHSPQLVHGISHKQAHVKSSSPQMSALLQYDAFLPAVAKKYACDGSEVIKALCSSKIYTLRERFLQGSKGFISTNALIFIGDLCS